MSAVPGTQPTGATASRLQTALGFVTFTVMGRPWCAFWLWLYPQARPAVLWALHDEVAAAPAGERWRRGARFLLRLPWFASAQAAAEGEPATRTDGDPPEPPSERPGIGDARRAGRVALEALGWVVALLFIAIAVVMWLRAFGTLFDLLDERPVPGTAVGALAVMMVVATLPLVLVHERRRFAWTPRWRAGTDQSVIVRIGWRLALAAFGFLAFVVWLRVVGGYFDGVEDGGIVTIGFSAALGMAALVVLAAGPLLYVVVRRHRVGNAPLDRAS